MTRNRKNSGKSGKNRPRHEQVFNEGDHESYDPSLMCQPIASSADDEEEKNPLKGLQLRMWDFAQCDPKRCTGARLERRGVFRAMPLKQPFKGIVLSPNGTVSVSPADRPILQEMVRRKNIDIQLCMARNVLILSLLQIYESIIGP